ncbi:MAG: DeoR/GlpR family DNA-binding transcription regulator [Bryobacteraceae bacterium]
MTGPKPDRLLAEERRREILAVLGQNGRITVEEVVRRFGVSAVTARGDLDTLSQKGVLVRSHGGGIRPLAAPPEHPLRVRQGIHHEEKTRIAHAAAQLICHSQTVILCTGSTSAELAAQIRDSAPDSLTIITYALNIASALSERIGLSLVMVGGILRRESSAFVGPQAEQMMESLHADHCFMSTVGLDVEVGLTTLDIMEAQLNRRMIQAARQVTVLADSSKFGHRSLSLISDFRSIQRVITDTAAPAADVEKLRLQGVEVYLA